MAKSSSRSRAHGPRPGAAGAKRARDVRGWHTEAGDAARVREIYEQILTRAPEHDFEPTLGRMQDFCELMADPQLAYRVVHVAGTNGKTSTARMAETILREHGLKTGLFTSPHLATVRERIQIAGEPISEAGFLEAWDEVEPVIALVDERSRAAGGPPMSFFEVFCALAFVAFANAAVEVAVIEVGMGGTWDATNVVRSEVQAIAPISLDHQAWLGATISQIAAEKAGILRGCAVIGEQAEEAAEVIAAEGAERGTTLKWQGADFEVAARQLAVGGQLLTVRGLGATYDEIYLPLFGSHQAGNAALALAACEVLLADGGALDAGTVRAAFAQVTSPGRLELVRSSPAVLVDAAHNPAGAESLVAAVNENFTPTRVTGLVGIMADKDAEAILGVLEPLLDEVVITASSSARSLPPERLGEIAAGVFGGDRVHVVPRLDEALVTAIDLAEAGEELAPLVIATGSIVLVAEVRTLLGATYPTPAPPGEQSGAADLIGQAALERVTEARAVAQAAGDGPSPGHGAAGEVAT